MLNHVTDIDDMKETARVIRLLESSKLCLVSLLLSVLDRLFIEIDTVCLYSLTERQAHEIEEPAVTATDIQNSGGTCAAHKISERSAQVAAMILGPKPSYSTIRAAFILSLDIGIVG